MPENLPELNSILYSGKLSFNKWGKRFEQSIRSYIGNDKFLAVNSYNSAMLIAISVLGLKPGAQVIASPMSCLASNQPFITQGLKVVWADIDPNTGTLDPDDVRKKITGKTKAIFHNHHCGYLGYIDEIKTICIEKGLYLVDDAIEAFGSEFKGKETGNLEADITVFSFQTVRLPNTVDGGGLAFGNYELFNKALLQRDLGINRSIFRDEFGEISKDCDIISPGFGAMISEFNSYIGESQMSIINILITKQRRNAEIWDDIIKKDNRIIKLSLTSHVKPNYWVYGCLSLNKRETISDFRNKGFYASGIHLNNNHYSIFSSTQSMSGVEEFYKKFVALPCGWWLTEDFTKD